MTDVAYGRVFSVSPEGTFDLVLEYDGEPCGIKFAADGGAWIADHKRGLLKVDFAVKSVNSFLSRRHSEAFKGLNDLTLGKDGTLYSPTRVCRICEIRQAAYIHRRAQRGGLAIHCALIPLCLTTRSHLFISTAM